MPTGACGINCDVCKLRLLGSCSSCGSGKSQEALKKLSAQKRIFGGTCTILECATMNKKAYCLRDCNAFPCENFTIGPYPYSKGFMDMQSRRRKEIPPAVTHHGTPLNVPGEYWEKLKEKNIYSLCNLILGDEYESGLVFRFLNENIWVDVENACLKRQKNNLWITTEDPLLELITLLYFNNVHSLYPLGKDIVSPKDLKEAHFFKNEHELKIEPLLERYSHDMDGFKQAAEYLDGKLIDMADIAYKLSPFPRIPLYYLFWDRDDEFDSRISILFDRSIEKHFSAAAIWGLVNRVTVALIKGPEKIA